eukprot:CAMPEP_0203883718 /NCGR_PEP_ID=MMETSP0359-20131031/27801_1 /ASSEMBLY_ACC=CAM_ASM_000338 /TAXON_ID=268821 /ORGANISM="Scrippsiella Hangoei, Strain SHTV-5" /LENGTH=183 /DNA_ID=CAMNT_0050804015 /DNA_START=43 /DNA_END=591 /DNA_ORIENTATION=+
MTAIKKVEPFLARAEELTAQEPVVAHYLRVYSLNILIKGKHAGESTPESDAKLMDVLGKAEDAKKSLDLSQGQETMESFALRVFDGADAKDRAGQADATSKKQFYVAGQMLDACAQFYDGELPPDLMEKAKYAKFRCMQIHDCLRRGVPIDPPPAREGDAAAAAGAGSSLAGSPDEEAALYAT